MKSKRKRRGQLFAAVVVLLCSQLFLSWPLGETQAAESSKTGQVAKTEKKDGETQEFSEQYLSVLEGKKAGVMTGTPQDQIVLSKIANAELQYFNNVTDMALALQTKKIDFLVLSTVNYYSMVEQYPQFAYLDIPLASFDIGSIFPSTAEGDALRAEFNAYIAKIKDSGELEQLQDYWLFPNEWEDIDIPSKGDNGTLLLATPNTIKPFSFMQNGKNAGFDIAIVAGFCREYGYGLQIENVDFAGALSGIATGKYDLAAGQISWTEERAKSVNYSDFYYTQKIVAFVNEDVVDSPALVTVEQKDNDTGVAAVSHEKSSLGQSIRRTLLEEKRWASILRGLLVTLLITFAGFLLANLLGALACAMARSGSGLLHGIARIYSGLMQGLPLVVVLMILYYIIFAHSRSNILAAVIAFGLVSGANMAQLFETSIGGVERGQWEAALAVGLSRRQVFMGIVFPQAIRNMLPGYFSNLISLMKGTAVVGYIAITDLTKVGDIIRGSTYEAFVPLVTVALIYLLLSCILFSLMKLIQRKLAPASPGKTSKKRDGQTEEGGERA